MKFTEVQRRCSPSSHVLPLACSAVAVSVARTGPELVVPGGAVRRRIGLRTPGVLRQGDRLHVVGTYARPIPAQVVDDQSLWNRAHEQFVQDTMGHDGLSASGAAETYEAVPGTDFPGYPGPAAVAYEEPVRDPIEQVTRHVLRPSLG